MEARYPVSQPAVVTKRPSQVIFSLPPTLLVQIPIQGIVRLPYVADPPQSKLAIDEITSGRVIFGRLQVYPIVDLSEIKEIIRLPIAEVISRVIYKVSQVPIPITVPSQLFAVIAPTVTPLTPPILALRGIIQDLNIVLPPSLIELPTADIVSRTILRGLIQDLPVTLPSKLYSVVADIVSNVIIRGLVQDIPVALPPKLYNVIADVVSRTILQGIKQDIIVVNPSSIIEIPIADLVSLTVLRSMLKESLDALPPSHLHDERVVSAVVTSVVRQWRNRQLWHRSSD